MGPLAAAMRPKHWIKNTFVFLPLLFGGKLFIGPENVRTLGAFALFSAASSAVYLVNDVLDAEADRRHPSKKERPVASGRLAPRTALAASAVLAALALAGSFTLAADLGWITAIYLGLNLAYSRFLKDKVIIDVFCLAAFFLLRLVAGSAVAWIELSPWIIFLTGLLALFLGFGKRRQELTQAAGEGRKVLQQYDAYFIDQMMGVVTASIVVAYMLYTVDESTVMRFGTQDLILSIPFVYYGIFRYLYLIHKAKIDGDPTTVLLSDLRMQVNLALWLAVCVGVVYFGL